MFYVQENPQYMHEQGVDAINPQFCGGPWQVVLKPLSKHLASNVDADADAIIMQALEDHFGEAAAPHLFEYLKRGTRAYQDALHVPGAVRWSGWTRITMHKIFHRAVRAEPTEIMDRAEAAARERGTEARLNRPLRERNASLNRVVWETGRWYPHFGPTTDPATGDRWFVRAGQWPMIRVLEQRMGDRNHPVAIQNFRPDKGRALIEFAGPAIAAAVAPELDGRVVRAPHKATGRELLAARPAPGAGYADRVGDFETRLWLPANDTDLDRTGEAWRNRWFDHENPHADRLATTALLAGEDDEPADAHRLHRTVEATDEGLRVERSFEGDAEAVEGEVTASWRLALADRKRATLSVRGGGVRELVDIRQMEPGVELEAGREGGYADRGADYRDEPWDTITAVSDAETVEYAVQSDDGEVRVSLNRGDDLAAKLSTPASGWDAVRVIPVLDEDDVEVTFAAASLPADGALAAQRLRAATEPSEQPLRDQRLQPQIRITGDGEAINERYGAELVYVPGRTFLRGSDSNGAGSDEGPVREIRVDGYWIYKHPVTFGQYKAYTEKTGRELETAFPQSRKWQNDPDVAPEKYTFVSHWFDANAFARWAGGALPTEAE